MKKRFTNILKSQLIKNVLVMITGTAGAQVIVVALSPIITRQYGPEAFGIMGTFSSMIAILLPIAALTYPVAIVLPKSNQKAKNIIVLSLIITVIFSFLSFVSIVILNEQIVKIFNINKISNYLYLIPLVIMFGGLMQVAEQWLIRIQHFSINAKVTFYQSLIINFSKVGIGLVHPVATVLVLFTAFGNGLKAFMMIFFIRKSSTKPLITLKNIKVKKLVDLAREYKDFPMYRAPESVLSKVSLGLPVLMLSAFFGPISAGYYTLGRTVLMMPSRFIGNAVGDVIYPRIAETYNNKKDIKPIIVKGTLALSGLGIIPFGAVILFGPYIFSIAFGIDWEVAGEYARWIALWSFTNFINKPSVRSLAVLNAQRFHLIYTILATFIRVISLVLGFYLFKSDIIAVGLFGVTGAILNIGLITISINISKKRMMHWK